MDQQITRTLPHVEKGPRVICRPQALNLCMSREAWRTSKSNLGNWNWMEREIDLASFNFGVPCVQSCAILKLDSHVESCPSSSFRRFESFTAQNTPLSSFANIFSTLWMRARTCTNVELSSTFLTLSFSRKELEGLFQKKKFEKLLEFLVGEGWGITHASLCPAEWSAPQKIQWSKWFRHGPTGSPSGAKMWSGEKGEVNGIKMDRRKDGNAHTVLHMS